MSLTARNVTKNQATYDLDRSKLLVFGNSFIQDATYRNVSGSAESVAEGQLMGIIAASGKWTVCKSGASDGSQIPRGIFLDTLTDIADSTDVENVSLVNGGKVNVAKLIFNGTDTLDTLVGGIRMQDLLIANCKDLELVTINDDSIADN